MTVRIPFGKYFK